MSDVTVTAYSDAARTVELDDVTTTETGQFSVFVPTLSGTVYLKAEPRELIQSDYSDSNYQNLVDAQNYVWFDTPATKPGGAIAVIPGQLLQFGTFKGYSVQPRITKVERGSVTEAFRAGTPPLINREPTDTIEVTWRYDTRSGSTAYSAAVDATVTFETDGSGVAGTVSTPDADARTAADGTSETHMRVSTYELGTGDEGDYGEIDITVAIDVIGADATAAAAESGSEELAAVASGVTGLTVERDIDVNAGARDEHNLSATWSSPGSPALEHRIALYVRVEASSSGTTVSGQEWVVFGTDPAEPTITRNVTPGSSAFGKWSSADFDLNDATNTGAADNWIDDDDSALEYTITAASLKATTHLRIDTRVTGSGAWTKHTPVAIPGG